MVSLTTFLESLLHVHKVGEAGKRKKKKRKKRFSSKYGLERLAQKG